MSDKTGTLTRNEMIFKHLRTPQGAFSYKNFETLKDSLNKAYLRQSRLDSVVFNEANPLEQDSLLLKQSEKALMKSLMCFMVCNNVSPIIDNGERILQAASPDEVALVNFAETMGF